MNEGLQLLGPLLNPWNAVVSVAVLMALEVTKYTAPEFFGNGGRGNRLLRLMCVLGCAIGYQIPGPWGAGDVVMNLFVGGFVGGVTTVGYALFADAFGFLRHKTPTQAGAWIDVVKKTALALIAVMIAGSGVYGAWLRPETGAKDAYAVTSQAIESLSQDVQALQTLVAEGAAARSELDKSLSIDTAVLTQRVAAMEMMLESRMAYKPEAGPPVGAGNVTISDPVVVHRGATEVSVETQRAPKIKRHGLEIKMPTAKEVF